MTFASRTALKRATSGGTLRSAGSVTCLLRGRRLYKRGNKGDRPVFMRAPFHLRQGNNDPPLRPPKMIGTQQICGLSRTLPSQAYLWPLETRKELVSQEPPAHE